jgi:hypothetical protein
MNGLKEIIFFFLFLLDEFISCVLKSTTMTRNEQQTKMVVRFFPDVRRRRVGGSERHGRRRVPDGEQLLAVQ